MATTPVIEPKLRALHALAARLAAKLPSGEGGAAWRAVLGQLSHITEAAQALHDLRTTRDPTMTPEAHQKRVLLATEKFNREVTATINRLSKIARDGHDDIAARIREKTKLAPDGYAPEVRAVYRGMTQTERVKLLGELVEQGRGSELAALVKAPATLTGMPEEFRQRFEAAFVARHAPDEVAEKAALDDALEHALTATRTASEMAATYADPAKLAEIAKAEAAAATAMNAFDAKVSA